MCTPPSTWARRAAHFTRFVYKSRWFVLSQTEGEPLPEPEIPYWDRHTALEALRVREIPFEHTDGNCLGYARDRSIAINPVNPLAAKTQFHELAHVLLGHTTEGVQTDSEITPRNLRECEAEDDRKHESPPSFDSPLSRRHTARPERWRRSGGNAGR